MNITRYDTSLASRIFDLFNILFLIALVFVTLYPLYYIGIVSVSDGNSVLRGDVTFWPKGFTLEAYELVLGDSVIRRITHALGVACQRLCTGRARRP